MSEITRNWPEVTKELGEIRRIKRLPVMRDGELVGIISRGDLLRALVQSIRMGSEIAREREAARARVTEIERQSWLQRTRTNP